MKNIFRISGIILLTLIIHSCKDKPATPVVRTIAVTDISYTTATSGGETTNQGGASVDGQGICWSTSADPTISDSKINESSELGIFVCNMTQLTPNTLYYVRAFANNSAGTGYGNQVSFTTSQVEVPVLTTTIITSTTETTAVSGGNITDDKGGSVTARGVCWGTATNPTTANSKTTDGTGKGIFTSSITGLIRNTTYYVRAYATNSAGTEYGNQVSFIASPLMPTLTTTTISSITQTSASSGGNVTSDGGATVTARGVCWSTTANPTTSDSKTTDGTGTGTYTSSIIGLAANTTYYVRAYATNSVGTGYGSVLSFTSNTVTDIEGNVYKTIIIGTQTWMAENLKTTKYNNGKAIPLVTDNTLWWSYVSAYCWYNNDTANRSAYGALYNWNAAKIVCPTGWHLPSEVDWTTLTVYLTNNGYGYEGSGSDIAKSLAATTGWNTFSTPGTIGNDQASNNSSGFTALPGGYRNSDILGKFGHIGSIGYWWSSTRSPKWTMPLGWSMYYNGNNLGGGVLHAEGFGFSVRCVKN